VRTWIDVTLAVSGRSVTGDITQPHVRPWSTAIRIPTESGLVWFKAAGPGSAHEGPLLECFRRLGVGHVLLPLAVHPERPWLLFADGGPTLRQTRLDDSGDHDLLAWERILRMYADVQRSVEADAAVDAMLEISTPDGRPSVLAGELHRLVEDDRIWTLLPEGDRDAGRRSRTVLNDIVGGSMLDDRLAVLSDPAIRPTIEHGDLHSNNILVNPDRDAIFDWGDAVVAHPFSTLTTTFNSIAHHTGRNLDDPAFIRLRDVYTEVWTDRLPRSRLIEVAAEARILGCIGKALAWERALQDLELAEMDGHGDGIAGWLIELVDWLAADPAGWISR
jgi:Phosphotransferase enzyme family